MSLLVKGGSFTLNSSTGNQAITGVGFQPKLILLFSTVGGPDTNNTQVSGAATDSSHQWAHSSHCYYPGALFSMQYLTDASVLVMAYYYSIGLMYIRADFVSMDSDGFTINNTTAQAGVPDIHYVAIGGTDFSASVGVSLGAAGTGSQAVTGVGFAPKCVLASTTTATLNDFTPQGFNDVHLGAATSSSSRWSMTSGAYTGFGATVDAGVLDTGHFLTHIEEGTYAVYTQADFVSMDSDGFTFNTTTYGGVQLYVAWVAMGGTAQYRVGTFAQPGSTGNQSVTGGGFAPSLDLLTSAGRVSSGSITAGWTNMFGAAISSSDRRVVHTVEQDGASTSGSPHYRETVANRSVQLRAMTSPYGVAADADFVSQDSGGFTNNWTTADATARILGYVSIGAASGGYLLDAAAATFTLAGVSVGIRAARRLTASAVSFSLAGVSVRLLRGFLLSAAKGTFTLTGVSANLSRTWKIIAAAATYALTGVSANLRAARRLTAASATYALTGNTARLLRGFLLSAVKGTFTLAGVAVDLAYAGGAKVLTAVTATFTLTGNAANLRVSRLMAAAKGTFTLTGQTVRLLRGFLLTAVKATFTLTGIAAGFSRTWRLVAAVASFVLTGRNANFTLGSTSWTRVDRNSDATYSQTARSADATYSQSARSSDDDWDVVGRGS